MVIQAERAVRTNREYKPSRVPRSSIAASIKSVVSERPERAAVAHLVDVSHRLAMSYLIRKANYGSLNVQFFGIKLDDMALDCIAELFQRNEQGAFFVLAKYFSNDQVNMEYQVALRRLVFSKVNESLFRRYHEMDANLSRIIRNVKDSAKAEDGFAIIRYSGQQWLVVRNTYDQVEPDGSCMPEYVESTFHVNRTTAPPEILESWFISLLKSSTRVGELLEGFRDFVDLHPHYARGYQLIGLAQVIRSAYRRLEFEEEGGGDDLLLPFELVGAVHLVTKRLMTEKWVSYVGRGKVSQGTYEGYFAAIRTILSDQYLYDPQPDCYYSALKEHLPEISEATYMREHRNILEYLAKLARTRLLRYLGDCV